MSQTTKKEGLYISRFNEFVIETFRRKTSSNKFIREIDGLRFFALFPVVLHHLGERIFRRLEMNNEISSVDILFYKLLPSGKLGVQIFFVISGFVIALPLIEKYLKSSTGLIDFSLKKYFLRRITRLEPPYVIVLLIIFFVLTFGLSEDSTILTGTSSFALGNNIPLLDSLIASLVYMHGFVFNLYPRLNPPAWSLEIEFQFYVLAPFVLLVIFYLTKGVQNKKLFIPYLAIFLLALKLGALLILPAHIQAFFVFEYMQYFVLGFALCFIYVNDWLKVHFLRKNATLFFITGLTILLVFDHIVKENFDTNILLLPSEERYLLLLASSFKYFGMVLFFVGVLSGGVGMRITKLTPINILGGMCYSIYLVHLPILQLTVALLFGYSPWIPSSFISIMLAFSVVIIPIVILFASVFFYFVEKPCMNPNWINEIKTKLVKN